MEMPNSHLKTIPLQRYEDRQHDENRIPYWAFKALMPILFTIIGSLIYGKIADIQRSFEKVENIIEKINETASKQNDRITRVEDAIIYIRDNLTNKGR